MAWTWSAPERGTVAVALLLSEGQQTLHNTLTLIGKGDITRGLCVAAAAYLTIVGSLATHLAPATLTSLLFLTGATLALLAASGLRNSDSSPRRNAAAAESIGRFAAAPAAFHEVLASADRKAITDRAAWSRLTAHMSHELRTPLNAVLGFSELMSNEVLGPMGSSCYTGYARDIHASGRMLLKSAEDALAITALLTAPDRKGPPSSTRLAAALDDAMAFHGPELTVSSVAIAASIDETCEILAEAQTVRQLLINVLADVLSRAAPGAGIDIASHVTPDAADICVTLSGPRHDRAQAGESFPLLLAQTLAELSGARLTCSPVEDGAWCIALRFTPASQPDFFG